MRRVSHAYFAPQSIADNRLDFRNGSPLRIIYDALTSDVSAIPICEIARPHSNFGGYRRAISEERGDAQSRR